MLSEHLFDALFVINQLLTGEIATGAVFNCCGSVGFGANLSKRLRLPLWERRWTLTSVFFRNPGPGLCPERPHFWISLLKAELGWRNEQSVHLCVCMHACVCARMCIFLCSCVCGHVSVSVCMCVCGCIRSTKAAAMPVAPTGLLPTPGTKEGLGYL